MGQQTQQTQQTPIVMDGQLIQHPIVDAPKQQQTPEQTIIQENYF